MALSPSIPTSFVPKQPAPNKKNQYSGSNLLLIIGCIIFVITLVVAGSVFLYSQYLSQEEKTKGQQLLAAQNSISQTSVNQFIVLRNRLIAAKQVLNAHVELSQFFTMLEGITLQDVQFNTLTVTVNSDRTANVSLSGEAKDFNALAAESSAFANSPSVQGAIFSGIGVNPTTGNVTFTINGTLTPSIVVENAAPSTTPVSAAPNNSTSTTTLGTTDIANTSDAADTSGTGDTSTTTP